MWYTCQPEQYIAFKPARTICMAWLPLRAPRAGTNGSELIRSQSLVAPTVAKVYAMGKEPASKLPIASQLFKVYTWGFERIAVVEGFQGPSAVLHHCHKDTTIINIHVIAFIRAHHLSAFQHPPGCRGELYFPIYLLLNALVACRHHCYVHLCLHCGHWLHCLVPWLLVGLEFEEDKLLQDNGFEQFFFLARKSSVFWTDAPYNSRPA